MKKDDIASRTTQVGFTHPAPPLNRPSFNCATPMKPIQEETSSITTPDCFDNRSHRSSFGDRCKSGTETPGRSGPIASVSCESDSNAASTPPYVKWANGFDSLLEDPEGQKVFQSYLRSEDALNNLMFWYAVNGFKTQVDKRKKYRLATVIGRTFLKKNSPNALTEISSENRKLILDSIRKDNIDGSTFDRAQLEIETFLKEKAYFMFLKSDVYIDYCNKIIQQQEQLLRNSDSKQGSIEVPTVSSSQILEGNSSVSSNHGTSVPPPGSTAVPANASGNFSSRAPETQLPANDSVNEIGEDVNTCKNSESVSSTSHDTTSVPSTKHSIAQAGSTTSQGNASINEAGLATVHEDTELLCKEINLRGGNKGFEATSDTFAASSPTCRKSSSDALNCSGCSYASTSGVNERKSHKGSHMYTNFAPVGSTNDSEIQSLSSDTHTDDSLSINDSVLDTSHLSSMGKRLQQHVVKRDRKYIKYSAQQNGSHARMFPHAQLTRSSHISTTNNVNRSQCEQNLSVPEFAALLIQKLEIAKSEKERSERATAQHDYRSNYHATVDSIDLNSTSASSSDGLSLSKPCRMPSSNVIMQSSSGGISYITSKSSNQNSASAPGGGGNSSADQEDPESIIDNHVSRVFRDSTHSPVNAARSKTPDKYSTMLTHQKCSSCGQNTFSQTLPPNYRNNQILQPGLGVPVSGSGVGFGGPGGMGSKHAKQMMPPSVAYENMHLAMQQGGGGGGSHMYSKSMRSSAAGPHSAHRKIMAESSSSKSTSSGVDSGVYDAQSLGSSDSYGGKHAMVTQWVETHRQQSSSHQSHLTKPEFNLSTVSHSSDPNMPAHGMNAAMPGVQLVPSGGGGSRRAMGGGASASRTGGGSSTTGRHSNAPGGMSGSAGGGLSVGSSNQLLAGSCTPSSQPTTQGQATQAALSQQQPPPPQPLPPQAHHQLSGSSSSSHRRSPVSSGLVPSASVMAGTVSSSSQNNTNNSSSSLAAAANTSTSSAPGGPSSGGAGAACCNSSSSPSQIPTSQPNSSNQQQQTVVAYYFCNETIPYRTTVPYKNVTLGQFKALLTRRGRFRYFFKMRSNEIELGGVVQQEITEDDDELPLFDGKIIGKIEKQ